MFHFFLCCASFGLLSVFQVSFSGRNGYYVENVHESVPKCFRMLFPRVRMLRLSYERVISILAVLRRFRYYHRFGIDGYIPEIETSLDATLQAAGVFLLHVTYN
jgi:hypothetical protein